MIQLSSSIISSTISTCIVYPAERVKLEMHLRKQLKSTKDAIRSIYEKYGLKGYYMGLSSEIFGNGLSYAIYFVAYAQAKKVFNFDASSLKSMIQSSGSAGTVATILTNPFWVLKTKQAQQKTSILEALEKIVKNEGIKSLWKGLIASLTLVSNPIIQFCVYEWLKKRKFVDPKSAFYDLIIFIIGAISKIIATIITYPYTLIRTKQHVSKKKIGMYETLIKQLQQSGIKGLYTGIGPKILQSVLNSAILLMVYERARLTLKNIFESAPK